MGIQEVEVGYQSEVLAVIRGRKKSDENLGWRSLNNRKEKDEKNEGAQDLYEPLADTSGFGRAGGDAASGNVQQANTALDLKED